jgi:sterol desaturase/sphingolipid hydroxylase (fatty acid hydroxylase superfamily)
MYFANQVYMDWLISFYKGSILGACVCLVGKILDEWVGFDSKNTLVKENERLVNDGDIAVQINLLCITPIVYTIVDQTLLTHESSFSFIDFSALLLIQNLGYFFAHREMHRNKKMYWIHKFHHQYDHILIPSIANAVSPQEFLLAYISPLALGGLLVKPTEITFAASVGVISLLNLVIHTQELAHVNWIPGLVSPAKHLKHHEVKDKNYAAPVLDVDSMLDTWEVVSIASYGNN